ncbi:MAG: nucleotidyltransferase family protein [Betaproteobacteria bacterium]
MNVVAILLAAGSARRFGSDKLLHPLPHDVPMAVQAARHLGAVFQQSVFAVVRPGAEALAVRLRSEGCTVVPCANADEGMGASLACGVRAAADAGGFVIALADMPFIRSSTIAAVRDALAAGAPLAAPYFRARRGHPVGIAASFREQLEALRGDEGARSVLDAHAAMLVKIPVGDPGAIRDIDTPGDLAPPIVV